MIEGERMVLEAARSYTQDKLQPRAIAALRDEAIDPVIFRGMGKTGLLGVTTPEDYGGIGASHVACGLVTREVERLDSGYRSMMSVQSSLVTYPIHACGSQTQPQRFLPKLANGDKIGCFGLTEPHAGSNPAGTRTVARNTADGYVVNGIQEGC